MKLITYSRLSQLLANNPDSIRKDRVPEKYVKQVELAKMLDNFIVKLILRG